MVQFVREMLCFIFISIKKHKELSLDVKNEINNLMKMDKNKIDGPLD